MGNCTKMPVFDGTRSLQVKTILWTDWRRLEGYQLSSFYNVKRYNANAVYRRQLIGQLSYFSIDNTAKTSSNIVLLTLHVDYHHGCLLIFRTGNTYNY